MMDEAASAGDVALEHLVNADIAGLGITRIAVAHRPEILAGADRWVSLHGGQVVHTIIAKLA